MREHRSPPERRQMVFGRDDHGQALPPSDVPEQERAISRMMPFWARANGRALQQSLLPRQRGQPDVVQESCHAQQHMHVVLKPNGAPGKEGEQAGIDGMRGVEFVMAAVGQAPPEVLGFGGERGDQFFHRQQRLRDIRLPVLRRRGDAVDRAHRGFIRVLRTYRRSLDHRR